MYDAQAQQLVADLGIERMKFAFEFYASEEIPGHPGFVGLSTTHPDGITTIIQVACGKGYHEAMDTLAHELRHSWQAHLAVYSRERDKKGVVWCVWRGSKFVPKPVRWRSFNALKVAKTDRKRYEAQAHEVDARAYARDAWVRLFKDSAPKREQRPRSISKLDDMFL